MPKPLNVNWSAVRVLAVAVGVREAACQMGSARTGQRLKREGWMACPIAIAQRALAKPCHQRVTKCPAPADALGNVLQQHERETELWLAMSKIQSVIARVEQLAGKIEVELSVVKRSMILVRLMGLGYGAENLA